MINNQNHSRHPELDSRHSVLDTESKTPKLRFKEFSGEWKEKSISDVLRIGSGKDYKHLDSGDIPVFGTGGYMASVNDYLYDGESVCIGRKGTINKPMFISGKFWTVDTLFYTHSYKNVIPKFLFAIFQRINWQQHNEASGVPSLSKSIIEPIKINIPDIDEQQKIASFLTAIDTKIDQLTKKQTLLKQYKKGIMQKIFSQELRFKADDGRGHPELDSGSQMLNQVQHDGAKREFPQWEEKKISKIFEITRGNVLAVPKMSQEKNDDFQYPVYSSQTKNKGLTGYFNEYLFEDCITWTTDGANAGDANLRRGKFYCTNVCGVLKSDKGYANQFIVEILNSVTKKYVSYVGNPKLMNNTMGGIKITIPSSIEEQTKIANFFSAIDTKIDIVTKQLEEVKQFKKGLLQQMFV